MLGTTRLAMVEAAGVGLCERADSKQVIDFSVLQETQKARKWANRYTRITRGFGVRVEYTDFL